MNISEGMYLSETLKYEAPLNYSRERVTVLSGQNLALGSVVGVVTASGKYKICDPAEDDGSEDAAGVLIQACDATSADNSNGLVVVRHAIVADTGLVWKTGTTTPQKTAAITQLKALGILVRSGV